MFVFPPLNSVPIPDMRIGDDITDVVLIDEEAIGCKGHGRRAKILYGKGALDQCLSDQTKNSEVYMALSIDVIRQ